MRLESLFNDKLQAISTATEGYYQVYLNKEYAGHEKHIGDIDTKNKRFYPRHYMGGEYSEICDAISLEELLSLIDLLT
jgi:hypothetical protein